MVTNAFQWPEGERPDDRIVALLVFLADDRAEALARLDDVRRRLLIAARNRCAKRRPTLDAEDVVQDTILRVAEKAGRERLQRENVVGYFFRTLEYIILEAMRPPVTRELPPDIPQVEIDERHRQGCPGACFKELNKDEQQLLTRYYEESAPEDRREQAADLKTSYGALRVRIHELRKRLRACVKDCESEKRVSV